MIKTLDSTITNPQERKKIVEQIIDENPDYNFSEKELEYLADYLVYAQEKEEKRIAKENGESYHYKRELLTPGRRPTIEKRETSYQGLAAKLESEDLIDNLVRNDKNMILSPKVEITDEDRKNIPFLQQLYDTIKMLEHSLATKQHSKRDAWIIYNKMIIPLRQDQYIIKEAYTKPARARILLKPTSKINFDSDTGYYDDNGDYVFVSENYLDFSKPEHISALLKNYDKLKIDSDDDVQGDVKYILWVLEDLIEKHIQYEYPHFFDIITWRIDKLTNKEISEKLKEKYDISHTPEYISNLATQRIPRILSEGYIEDYVMWFYTYKRKGSWKKCNRCGESKPRLLRFWSKNKGSKDGLYSICKCCRSIKRGKNPREAS